MKQNPFIKRNDQGKLVLYGLGTYALILLVGALFAALALHFLL